MTSSQPSSETTAGGREFDLVDISTKAFWAQAPEQREVSFAELRRHAPVSWQRPIETDMAPPGIPGFWAVTTHDLIREVSVHPELFCSGQGTMLEEVPEEFLEAASSFLAMDGDRHLTYRRLMSSSFTPKRVKKIEEQIRLRAIDIVEGFIARGEGDWVESVAKQMPMNTFYDMAGLPQESRDQAAHFADELAGWNDPDIAHGRTAAEVINDAIIGNLGIGLEFAEMTRACPRNDIWTNLVAAEVDGHKLTDDELASMFVLMSFAGNDTTRTTLSLGTKAFVDNPDQITYLLEDFDGRIDAAVDEVLRWVTPVMTFRRTATQDTMLGGRQVRKGDWVVMIYSSGNRDETVFADPWRFDITRKPNAHVAFGGGGPHFCLGAFLAKMQIKHMLDQILHRMPDLRLGQPALLVSNFAAAVKHMDASTGCPVKH
ncbi:cytochrome P450 [Mycolicibacterium palauense]|uniref:cytochrome P450 n=1 Tax=Mycolicibacterium palauense TaxID=2034511 RepID=UPI000BFF0075|nr:cytochrome P450 [Mycolicibacterium palauense]